MLFGEVISTDEALPYRAQDEPDRAESHAADDARHVARIRGGAARPGPLRHGPLPDATPAGGQPI